MDNSAAAVFGPPLRLICTKAIGLLWKPAVTSLSNYLSQPHEHINTSTPNVAGGGTEAERIKGIRRGEEDGDAN